MSNNRPHKPHHCGGRRFPHRIPRGLLRYVVLRIIQEKSRSGVDISEYLSQHTDGKWSPSPGTLYPILAHLEQDGLIEVISTDGRSKYYQATAQSSTAIATFERSHREITNSMEIFRRLLLHVVKPKDQWKYIIKNIEANLVSLEELMPSFDPKILPKLQIQLSKLTQQMQALQSTLSDRE